MSVSLLGIDQPTPRAPRVRYCPVLEVSFHADQERARGLPFAAPTQPRAGLHNSPSGGPLCDSPRLVRCRTKLLGQPVPATGCSRGVAELCISSVDGGPSRSTIVIPDLPSRSGRGGPRSRADPFSGTLRAWFRAGYSGESCQVPGRIGRMSLCSALPGVSSNSLTGFRAIKNHSARGGRRWRV
jgi:hypothetical protein